MSETGDRVEDGELLHRAVRAAGAAALDFFRADPRRWEKRPGDPVSEADLAADALLREALLGARPGYGWISEESEASAPAAGSRRTWVVDPIDGTRAFLDGRDEWSVSVALIDDGAPVLGAVFNPARKEFYHARQAAGAYHASTRLTVTERSDPVGCRIAISRSERHEIDFESRFPGCEAFAVSSIAYKLALVAAGQVDALVSLRPKSLWDIAAGVLLVLEAGGQVARADGSPTAIDPAHTREPSLLAASPHLHDALVARIAEADSG